MSNSLAQVDILKRLESIIKNELLHAEEIVFQKLHEKLQTPCGSINNKDPNRFEFVRDVISNIKETVRTDCTAYDTFIEVLESFSVPGLKDLSGMLITHKRGEIEKQKFQLSLYQQSSASFHATKESMSSASSHATKESMASPTLVIPNILTPTKTTSTDTRASASCRYGKNKDLKRLQERKRQPLKNLPKNSRKTSKHSATHQLSIKDLSKVLEETCEARAKWYEIGLGLKLSPGTLDAIDQGDGCYRKMLQEWLQTGTSRTWADLAIAMERKSVRRPDLAKTIKDM